MIAAFIYSRSNSERLPNKAFKNVGDKKLIEHVIHSTLELHVDLEVILLTSNHPQDDKLEEIALNSGIKCMRGSLNNVALRTIQAIEEFKVKKFLRINGDTPILLNSLYEEGLKYSKDYEIVSNILERTYNYGISFELISSELFLKYYEEFNETDREHITNYFYRNQKSFKIKSITSSENYFKKGKKLAIDTYEDLEFMDKILKSYPNARKWDIKTLNEKINNIL